MFKQPLYTGWSVKPVSNLDHVPATCHESTPATVPGCVHTDLLRAGKIDDPYYDRNAQTLEWIGRTDWRYETTFTADAGLFEHERIDLAADGLDTVATIELNGNVIAKTENMHVGYRFDVKPHLKPGQNTLAVTFASAELYAFAMEKRMGKLPFLNARVPFNMIRKMACNFGWDWGPELVTCGIWRGIRLEGWETVRIDRVVPRIVNLSDAECDLEIDVRLELARPLEDGMRLLVVADIEPHHLAGSMEEIYEEIRTPKNLRAELHPRFKCELRGDTNQCTLKTKILEPRKWWPHGYGQQHSYPLKVWVNPIDDRKDGLQKNLSTADMWKSRIGLRTVELDTAPDATGAKFILKINGKPIFCKGYNWIPDDAFLDRACTPERYRERIQQAVDSNANMLRVWGGGIYETDEFFDICDELGVLVWQDFLFACAAYAEEEPFKSLVDQEARYNVARLAHHPSLVIWNGCNENMWGYHDWGWKKDGLVAGRTWGPGYYLDLLPKIVAELDPSRPYWAASPWSGDPNFETGLHPNLATHGNKHVWEAWFGEDYLSYRRFEPRFCSEFGFQGPATYASIAAQVPADSLDLASVSMRNRQKSTGLLDDGDRRNLRHLSQTFEVDGLSELMISLRHPREGEKIPTGAFVDIHAPGQSNTNFDDLHYLLTINQARALTLGVEWFRSRQPICMGTLYWQLNDNWPGAMSWSAIDGDGRPKPLWFATRRFYSPQLLTIQPDGETFSPGDPLYLFDINDSDERDASRVLVTRKSFDGKVLAEQGIKVESPTRSVRKYKLDPAIYTPSDPSSELIAVDSPTQATWFFDVDKNLNYPPAEYGTALKHDGNKTRLTVTAKTLIRDLLIQVDRLDPAATISDNLITLLPGESFTFVIDSKLDLSQKALTSSPVFNYANHFGKRT